MRRVPMCARASELVVVRRTVLGALNIRQRPRPDRHSSRGPGRFRSGPGRSGRGRSGCGAVLGGVGRSPLRLVLEVLLWLVGRYS